jgi:hypothetical protein
VVSAVVGTSLRRIVERAGTERATTRATGGVATRCGARTEAAGDGAGALGSVGPGVVVLGDGATCCIATITSSGDGAPMIECAAACQSCGNTLAYAAAAAASAVITTTASPHTA